jgi:hypothetical protein
VKGESAFGAAGSADDSPGLAEVIGDQCHFELAARLDIRC